eukprot:Skav207395  [mRNA]  locus=scaffold2421:96854:101985:+ [translate_table: standard]
MRCLQTVRLVAGLILLPVATANLRGGINWAECGVLGQSTATQRIVHGQDAGQCVWRWQVSLSSASDGQFCTLISPEWVLTAAHCITKVRSACEVRKLRIGAGTWKRREDVDVSDTSVERKVTKENVAHDYDFALLQLDKAVPINRCIGAACLPRSWGTLVSSGPTPELLQEAKVTLLTNQVCEVNYTESKNTITGSMLCATGMSQKGITDTCQGDSGGPLVCKETVETRDGRMMSDRYVLRGVTSWGQGCAYEGYPGVYGRVHSVMSWIEDIMENKVKKVYAADVKEDFSSLDFGDKMWLVVSGECTIDSSNCLLSPGFPEPYEDGQQCKVAINPSGALPLAVMNFSTELGFDKLYVDCKSFSGDTGPDGVVPTSAIFWTSDASVTESGWRICPDTS